MARHSEVMAMPWKTVLAVDERLVHVLNALEDSGRSARRVLESAS